MGRTVAIAWHASFSIIAAGLYVLFVLPRWWELTGYIPHSIGTALRIVTAVLIGLTALPVVFTWLRTRKPEFGVPQLALSLRVWSTVAHVLAGVLIVVAAISEIWLSLDSFGQYLFGSYGAAAAIAILGIAAFYLSFVAELPPPPPKPIKPKQPKQSRKDRKKAKRAEETDATGDTPDEPEEAEQTEDAEAEESADADETTETEDSAGADDQPEPSDGTAEAEAGSDETEPAGAKLRNRRPAGRPTGKTRNRRRDRGSGDAGTTVSTD